MNDAQQTIQKSPASYCYITTYTPADKHETSHNSAKCCVLSSSMHVGMMIYIHLVKTII
jgi:hypothetical protein